LCVAPHTPVAKWTPAEVARLSRAARPTGIRIPEEVLEALGSGKRPAVTVTINGYSILNPASSTPFKQRLACPRLRDLARFGFQLKGRPMAEKVVLVCDVCGHAAAESVTFKLGNRTLAQDLCPTHAQELVRNAHAPRRRRKPNVALPSVESPERSRSGRRGVAARQSGKRSSAKSPRRRITDPVTLEKRRTALEKARQALAKKRAAAKRAS
jgi:hypothetical protein